MRAASLALLIALAAPSVGTAQTRVGLAPIGSTRAATRAPGAPPSPPGTRAVGALTQTRTVNGERVVSRVRRQELPPSERLGRIVHVRDGDRTLTRRTTRDGPVVNGRFVRETRTTAVFASRGSTPSWRAPGATRPSQRDAPHLYTSRQLGPVFRANDVRVRLFAPTAGRVTLVLHDTDERFEATQNREGVWEASVGRAPRTLYGQRYSFEVDGQQIADPYSHAVDGDYGPSIFVDLGAHEATDDGFRMPPPQQLILAETHVRDMTAHPSAPVGDAPRGTYTAFAAPAITQHYHELHVNAVELLPVHAYDDHSGDVVDGKATANHWGYMSSHYFSPEQRYGTSPAAAPRELQATVAAYHRRGIGVVMDVVYNHTAKGPTLNFRVLGQNYYYRLQANGCDHNGAGCGNELRTESPMARRLVVDSVRHFATRYRVDGFRFDLGSLLDMHTMRAVDRALPSHVFLTAEPWAAEWHRSQWGKEAVAGAFADTRWSVWNDQFRDSVNRFALGHAGDDHGRDSLITAVAGSARPFGFTLRPSQTVNYVESHDELSSADRFGGNARRMLLASTALLTSQGAVMLGHGQEFMRSKQLAGRPIANVHNQDNDASHVDWSLRDRHRDVLGVHQRLTALRSALPQFRLDRPLTARDVEWIRPDNRNQLGYVLRPPESSARGTPEMLVLLNSDSHASMSVDLPSGGPWRVETFGTHVGRDDQRQTTRSGRVELPAGTAAVLTRTPQ